MSWEEITKDSEFQALDQNSKTTVLRGWYQDNVASDPEYKVLPTEQKFKVMRGHEIDAGLYQAPEQPSFIKDVVGGTAKQFGKELLGAGEVAAQVASGIPGFIVDAGISVGAGYGTLARGGSLDEAAQNITGMQELVRPFVVYQPKTEEGRRASENLGKALHWLIGKPSEIAGKTGQKVISPIAGETAGAITGAGIQTLSELAGYTALFGTVTMGGKKLAGIKEQIKTRPPTDKDVIDFENFIKDEAARLKGKNLNLDDILEALRGRKASKAAYDYITVLPVEERSQLAKSILRGKGIVEPPPIIQPETVKRGIALSPQEKVTPTIKPTGFDENIKINEITSKQAGDMMAQGKPEVAKHIKEGIDSSKWTPEEMQHIVNNEIMLKVAEAPKGEARQQVRENISKVEPIVKQAMEDIKSPAVIPPKEPITLYRGEMTPTTNIGEKRNILHIKGLETVIPALLPENVTKNYRNALKQLALEEQKSIQKLKTEKDPYTRNNLRTTIEQVRLNRNDILRTLDKMSKQQQEENIQKKIIEKNKDIVYASESPEIAKQYMSQFEGNKSEILFGRKPEGYKPTLFEIKVSPEKVFDMTKYSDENGILSIGDISKIADDLGIKNKEKLYELINADDERGTQSFSFLRNKALPFMRKVLSNRGYDAVKFSEHGISNYAILNREKISKVEPVKQAMEGERRVDLEKREKVDTYIRSLDKTPDELAADERLKAVWEKIRTEKPGEVQDISQVVGEMRKPTISQKADMSLTQWIRQKGGINDEGMSGEVTRLQNMNLIRKDGLSYDRLRENAVEEGFINQDTSVSEFIDLIEKDATALARKNEAGRVYSKVSEPILPKEPRPEIMTSKLDLAVGDEFKIEGEKYVVKGKDAEGNLIIEDGQRFEVDPVFDRIPEPDIGSLKHKETGGQSKLISVQPKVPETKLQPKVKQKEGFEMLDEIRTRDFEARQGKLPTEQKAEIPDIEVTGYTDILGHWTNIPMKAKEALEINQEMFDITNKRYDEAINSLPKELKTKLKKYLSKADKKGLSEKEAQLEALQKLRKDIEIERTEIQKQIDEAVAKQPEPVIEGKPATKGEMPAPTGITEGSRVKFAKSPQDYTVISEKPFDPKTDIEGERYFDVKNNKTGVIEKNIPLEDLKEIKGKAEGKIEAGSLAYGQKLPKYAGNVNLERLDSPYAVKKTILDIADQYKGKMEEARREEISLEETRNLANDLGMTKKELLKRRKGEAFNAEEAVASRDILNASAARLRQLQEEAVKIGTDEALLKFKLAVEQHAAIQAAVSGMTAEAGRALSSFRIKSEATAKTKNYKVILDVLGGRELTEDILKKLAQIDITDTGAVNKFIRQVSKAKTSDMVFEAWINSILSGLLTHIVNITSNLVTFLSKPAESMISASIEIGKQTIIGKPRERFFGEVKAETIGAVKGIKEGVRAAIKTYATEMPSDIISKIETTKYQAIPSKTITVKGKEYEIGGKQVRIPGRLLLAADDFFKAIIYRAELNSEAYRIASKEGLRGRERLNRMVELVDNPTEKMMEMAHNEAQYRTFTKPLGKIGNQLMALRNKTPGLKYIIPFLRTPINIAKFGLERTPLNFIRLAYKKGKGEFKGAEFSDELAKPILGSLIGLAVVILAQADSITGGGPKDKDDRNTLYRGGWQPYSVKIGDTYYAYNRVEPLGSIMGMAADFNELVSDKDREEIASKIALSISKNITSKTFMQGLSGAMDAISDPDRYAEKWLNQVSGSLIPNLSASIARSTDETMRVTETPLETIQSKIPFISEDLLPKRDLWGKEIKRTGTFATRLISPVAISVGSSDKVNKEMIRLLEIGDFKIGMPDKKVAGIELSNEEYDKYVKIAGESAKKELDKIVDSKIWDKLPDENKARIFKAIIQNKRDAAKGEVLKTLDRKKVIQQYIENRRLIKQASP